MPAYVVGSPRLILIISQVSVQPKKSVPGMTPFIAGCINNENPRRKKKKVCNERLPLSSLGPAGEKPGEVAGSNQAQRILAALPIVLFPRMFPTHGMHSDNYVRL